jgi:hypothetical protein
MLGVQCARSLRLVELVLALGVCAVACGDDDTSPHDAGSGMDAAAKDAGPTHIPRRDAQVTTTDPIPPCDRSDPQSCAAGQTCDRVLRRAAGDTSYTFYDGCVTTTQERAKGDPCDIDPTDGTPYSAPGLTDEVFRDPCGSGLICAPDRAVRGSASCQTACATGNLGDTPIACASPTAVCFPGSQIAEYCLESQGCDVVAQTGCLPGEACYLVPSDDGKRLLALCTAPETQPDADGQACSPLTCQPGSICLGPVHLPPTRWQTTDLVCRPTCTVGGSNEDAGQDDDAGTARGTCGTKALCQPFVESGLNLSAIPKPPYGQCEP